MEIPDFITRYYVAGEDPFLSLNDHPLNEAQRIRDAHDRRFTWGGFYASPEYVTRRKAVEQWVRERHIEKGGKASTEAPVYFILGENPLFDSEFGRMGGKISLPFSTLDPSYISFTSSDSMFEFLMDDHGEYTGEARPTLEPVVYSYDELHEAIAVLTRINARSRHTMSIEAQVWNREILRLSLDKIS